MTEHIICLLAQATTAPITTPGVSREPVLSRDIMLILGVAGLIAFTVVIWAFFIRRRRHPDPHVRVLDSRPIPVSMDDSDSDHHHKRRRRKRRRLRSSELPRNPTLQQTGGLPPLRPEGELPKY